MLETKDIPLGIPGDEDLGYDLGIEGYIFTKFFYSTDFLPELRLF